MNVTKPEPSDSLRAITVGVDEHALRMLHEILPAVEFKDLPMDIGKVLKSDGERDPDLIFCGRTDKYVDLVDLAQGVRAVFAEPPMYYVSSLREGFDQGALVRNGFADAFLLPLDKGILGSLVPDSSLEYKDVPLIGLTTDTVLEFDTYVYLPLNRKYIRFSAGGRIFESDRAQRLMNHEVRSVYVSKTQLPAYHRFTAKQLKQISTGADADPIERRRQMHGAIRSLMAGFLSDNAAMEDYAAIVKTYFLESEEKAESLYERILEFTSGGGDIYSHVANVSSLAVLFALGLGVGKPEEIALAGLLHDIGLADVSAEVQEKNPAQRSESEQRMYNEHPALALKLIKKRQIELSTKVLKIIEQHHERWDARGYPLELRGEAILPESQLLAIADEFEYHTQLKAGHARKTARAAMEAIMANPGFDPDLKKRLAEMLGIQ